MENTFKSPSYKFRLIDAVKRTPELWQLSKKAPELKQKLWKEVGRELGIDGAYAQRHWEVLRDQFRREINKMGFDSNYKPRWLYYDRMLFMQQFVRPREARRAKSDSDAGHMSPIDPSQFVEQSLVTKEEEEEEKYSVEPAVQIQVRQDLHAAASTDNGEQGLCSPPSTITWVSSSSGVRPRYEAAEQSPQQRRRKRRYTESVDDDEDYHFVMSILPSLQSIQHPQKLRVRGKIIEVIAKELETANGFKVRSTDEIED